MNSSPMPDWKPLQRLAGPETQGTAWLDAEDPAYLVTGGPADLFAVKPGRPGVRGRRHFVARISEGSLVPAVAGGRLRMELVRLPGTSIFPLSRLPLNGATATDQDEGEAKLDTLEQAAASSLDRFLLAITESIRTGQMPRDSIALQRQQILSVAAGQAVTGNAQLWWVRAIGGCLLRKDALYSHRVLQSELTVLAGRDWLVAEDDCTLEALCTADLLASGQLAEAVERYLAGLLPGIQLRVEQSLQRTTDSLQARKRVNSSVVASAARSAIGVLGVHPRRIDYVTGDELAIDPYRRARSIVRVVTESANRSLTLSEPVDRRTLPADDMAAIHAMCSSSALNIRQVRLPARWWRQDVGPLIGWRTHDGDQPQQAVVLVFRRGGYHEIEPETRLSRRVVALTAAELASTATQVQVPLARQSSLTSTLRQGMLGTGTDLRTVALTGALTAALGLAVPLVTGVLLAELAANSSVHGILTFLSILLCSAVIGAVALVTQNLHVLRIEGRGEIGTQLAVWDRLMRLPVRFYRAVASGELANSVVGITYVRQSVSAIFLPAVGAFFTVVGDLVLIFIVVPALAPYVLGFLLGYAVLLALLGRLVIGRARISLTHENHAVALTNQLLGAVSKIKIAGAEDRSYAQWAAANSLARGALLPVRRVQAAVAAMSVVLPISSQLLLFLTLAGPLNERVDTTSFFMVNVAFGLLVGALLVLASAGIEIAAAYPRLESLVPILATAAEQREDHIAPGELTGAISLASVSFSYLPDEPPVVQDVSLQVHPGEFVALVGPSGCGKSTLLRLLLGFEKPRSGAVLYDNQDLSELDVQAVRRQCGVVLQDGQLFSGNIRDNICGAGNFGLDQIWAAASLAGIAKDIEGFPMGMSTMISVGGGTLSVGQRQRVLIARALIHQPRILFFDEATSALDNRTQHIVTTSTRSLAATRIVIAHRLSTVMDADRILVMERGRIVQQGTYQQLMAEPEGLFARLAMRQLVGSESAESR